MTRQPQVSVSAFTLIETQFLVVKGLGGAKFALLACLLLGFCCLLCLFVFLLFLQVPGCLGPVHPGFHLSLPLISPWEDWAYRCVSSHVQFTWLLGIRTLVLMFAG